MNKISKITVNGSEYQISSPDAGKLTTARSIDGVNFDGTKNIRHYGVCSTTASVIDKVVPCPDFVLTSGAKITVRFTVNNTAANPQLNVNSTGAAPIYYKGSPIASDYIKANGVYDFVYNGSEYDLIGNVDLQDAALLEPNNNFATTANINVQIITEAAYSALATKDDNTLYIIKAAP